jgi:hypothetical protein
MAVERAIDYALRGGIEVPLRCRGIEHGVGRGCWRWRQQNAVFRKPLPHGLAIVRGLRDEGAQIAGLVLECLLEEDHRVPAVWGPLEPPQRFEQVAALRWADDHAQDAGPRGNGSAGMGIPEGVDVGVKPLCSKGNRIHCFSSSLG